MRLDQGRREMRFATPVLTMLLAAATLAAAAPAANAQTCQQLWVERNSYYKAAGYCFHTERARSYFGNAGCRYSDESRVPLSDRTRARIARIRQLERAMGCDD
jgi:hypothetical protein